MMNKNKNENQSLKIINDYQYTSSTLSEQLIFVDFGLRKIDICFSKHVFSRMARHLCSYRTMFKQSLKIQVPLCSLIWMGSTMETCCILRAISNTNFKYFSVMFWHISIHTQHYKMLFLVFVCVKRRSLGVFVSQASMQSLNSKKEGFISFFTSISQINPQQPSTPHFHLHKPQSSTLHHNILSTFGRSLPYIFFVSLV